jgi:gamma-glutamylcysteine synthetase
MGPADDPRQVIVEYARHLDRRNVALRQLGIQFVQIGNDPDATEALKELDDNLGPMHGVRVRKRAKPSS